MKNKKRKILEDLVRNIKMTFQGNLTSEEEYIAHALIELNKIDKTDIDELICKFNAFIKKWCVNDYSHLIDNDENDGENFRQAIRNLREE